MPEPSHSFIIGQSYKRQLDIHAQYGGQRQSGISTPQNHQLVFIFTGDSGSAYGYKDSHMSDGTYWYTGEGQVGDMQMVSGNAAIKNHKERAKHLLLFETAPENKVKFLGEVEYLGHHIETRSDRNGLPRNAFIFHLGFIGEDANPGQPSTATTYPEGKLPTRKLSLKELRALAITGEHPDATTAQKLINLQIRAEAVRRYALARAAGACEGCRNPAPFETRKGPYLEVHHVYRLSDGGPDHPGNVIALCPNCHRRAHYSNDAAQFNQDLCHWLKIREAT